METLLPPGVPPIAAPTDDRPGGEDGPDWAGAVNRIRDTALWITKAFTAIAALLIGTGPLLINLSDLSWGARSLAAGAGAAVALLGVGLVIRWATQVMLPETTNLVDLAGARTGALKDLVDAESQTERLVHADGSVRSVKGLFHSIAAWRRTVEALARYDQQVKAFNQARPAPGVAILTGPLQDPSARVQVGGALSAATATLHQLTARAQELMRQGVYVKVRATFVRARRMMLTGGALTAAGLAVYIAALGIDLGKADPAGQASAPSADTVVQTLTWKATDDPSARPVRDVRHDLGFDGSSCDQVFVVVREGKGRAADPYLVTSLAGGACPTPPRQFRIDDRYAEVSVSPATTFTLDPVTQSNETPTAILAGIIAAALLIGGWAGLRRLQR